MRNARGISYVSGFRYLRALHYITSASDCVTLSCWCSSGEEWLSGFCWQQDFCRWVQPATTCFLLFRISFISICIFFLFGFVTIFLFVFVNIFVFVFVSLIIPWFMEIEDEGNIWMCQSGRVFSLSLWLGEAGEI